jgi:hypothetical protein
VSKSNRIVVFDVGGVIKISERIVVSKNIYIAGQTAPGGVSPHRKLFSYTKESIGNCSLWKWLVFVQRQRFYCTIHHDPYG